MLGFCLYSLFIHFVNIVSKELQIFIQSEVHFSSFSIMINGILVFLEIILRLENIASIVSMF